MVSQWQDRVSNEQEVSGTSTYISEVQWEHDTLSMVGWNVSENDSSGNSTCDLETQGGLDALSMAGYSWHEKGVSGTSTYNWELQRSPNHLSMVRFFLLHENVLGRRIEELIDSQKKWRSLDGKTIKIRVGCLRYAHETSRGPEEILKTSQWPQQYQMRRATRIRAQKNLEA